MKKTSKLLMFKADNHPEVILPIEHVGIEVELGCPKVFASTNPHIYWSISQEEYFRIRKILIERDK